MQGGIHPEFDWETYLSLIKAAKRGAPEMHVHAFSPLEVRHGASTYKGGVSVSAYLSLLKQAGLGSLPGTAAEILSNDVRHELCPDKLDTKVRLGLSQIPPLFAHTRLTLFFYKKGVARRGVQCARRGYSDHLDDDVRPRGRRHD